MARLTPEFRAESERIHNEHRTMLVELEELERQLDHLAPAANPSADWNRISDVREYGRRLMKELTEHCLREEKEVHARVADVSPELAEFCRVMKQEHDATQARFQAFSRALEEFDHTPDVSAAVVRIKEEGTMLARAVRRHIETEEQELSGFL